MRGRKRDLRAPPGPPVNDEIWFRECRLIGKDRQYGVVGMDEARRIAREEGLDLVVVSPGTTPPVVKLIDYGKFKYDQQKKANETKKRQSQAGLKEIQFRPNIDQHDLDTKVKRALRFFLQGDKVKAVMRFRGREMANREAGEGRFRSIIDILVGLGSVVESRPKMVGNRTLAILAPDKKEMARRKREAEKGASSEAPAAEGGSAPGGSAPAAPAAEGGSAPGGSAPAAPAAEGGSAPGGSAPGGSAPAAPAAEGGSAPGGSAPAAPAAEGGSAPGGSAPAASRGAGDGGAKTPSGAP